MKKFIVILMTVVFVLVGCGGGGGSDSSAPSNNNPSSPVSQISANFSGYKALFAVRTSESGNVIQSVIGSEESESSTIVKITSTGEVVNALTTNLSLDIKSIERGPDGIYLVLGSPVAYESGSDTKYAILKVADDGTVSGIDSEISNVWIYSVDNPASLRILNRPLQWDSHGNMYYIAEFSNNRNIQSLRKYSTNGEITDVISRDASAFMYDFLVLSDDSIMVNGLTTTDLSGWVKRIFSDDSTEFVNEVGASMCMVQIGNGVLISDIDGKEMYNPTDKTKTHMADWDGLGWFKKVVKIKIESSVYVLSNDGRVFDITSNVEDVTPDDINYVTDFCGSQSGELIISGTTSTVSGFGSEIIFDEYAFKTYVGTTETSMNLHVTSLQEVDGKIVFIGLTENGMVTGGIYDPQTDHQVKTDLAADYVISYLFNG